MKRNILSIALFVMAIFSIPSQPVDAADIRTVPTDLTVPKMTREDPAAGRRARQTLDAYKDTDVHHVLYLPTDWKPDQKWPVIVEYPGNGPYQNKIGDHCTGRLEDCNLGYGISGGKGYIWICMPYISADHKQNQLKWWGDADATVQYCIETVRMVCKRYGGDPQAVILSGFSRGAIACNYIGLYNNEIAGLWAGFICHSHYDGVRLWGYPEDDRDSAAERLARLDGRPQWISHERSIDQTRDYLSKTCPDGNFTFRAIPYQNHTDTWTLRDIPERHDLREFCRRICQ